MADPIVFYGPNAGSGAESGSALGWRESLPVRPAHASLRLLPVVPDGSSLEASTLSDAGWDPGITPVEMNALQGFEVTFHASVSWLSIAATRFRTARRASRPSVGSHDGFDRRRGAYG